MKAIPTHSETWEVCGGVSGMNSCTKRPERSITKPKAMSASAVRFQASKVRSAAKNTLGSFRSDIGHSIRFSARSGKPGIRSLGFVDSRLADNARPLRRLGLDMRAKRLGRQGPGFES